MPTSLQLWAPSAGSLRVRGTWHGRLTWSGVCELHVYETSPHQVTVELPRVGLNLRLSVWTQGDSSEADVADQLNGSLQTCGIQSNMTLPKCVCWVLSSTLRVLLAETSPILNLQSSSFCSSSPIPYLTPETQSQNKDFVFLVTWKNAWGSGGSGEGEHKLNLGNTTVKNSNKLFPIKYWFSTPVYATTLIF